MTERAALVTLLSDKLITEYDDEDLIDRRQEMSSLLITAGAHPVAEFTQRRSSPDPATFIGSGKSEEIGEVVEQAGIDLVVFNHELRPSQQRNLDATIPAKVIDRTRLILDIFAQRAQSREGKLQVELAQLYYLLPRLTGIGEELSRLGGGIGTRGPGETKLETDRRRIQERMAEIRREIEGVRKHRRVLRESRYRKRQAVFSLVGYTNAGKSTLMNNLASAEQLAEDKLFATLDPTVRSIQLSHGARVCLVDTVGFVRDLPQQLLAAFRATLEEVSESDCLLHVVDVSHPKWCEHIEVVMDVLRQLDALDRDIITVLNKADRLSSKPARSAIDILPDSVLVSALTGDGLDVLKEKMSNVAREDWVRQTFMIPYCKMDLIDEVHQLGEIHREEYTSRGVEIEATLHESMAARTRRRITDDENRNKH